MVMNAEQAGVCKTTVVACPKLCPSFHQEKLTKIKLKILTVVGIPAGIRTSSLCNACLRGVPLS